MCQNFIGGFPMDIKCKYKVVAGGINCLGITCRIRFPFEVKLSADEKKEIVSSIYKTQNVPKQYKEIYDSIASIHFPQRGIASREIAFTTCTKDDLSYVDIVMYFGWIKNFETFTKENRKIFSAEKF